MELRQLEHFVAVAQEMNFSRAAERVHIVQSALSTSIAKLEKELGVPLFDRSRRQITLTTPGEVFLEHARTVLQNVRTAAEAVTAFEGQLTGVVEFGTLMSSGPLDLPRILGEFRRRHRFVTVRMRQSPYGSAGHLAAVANGTLDLALVSSTSAASERIVLRRLSTEELVYVCAGRHRFAGRRSVRIVDLSNEPLIGYAEGWGLRGTLDRAFGAADIAPPVAFEVADYDMAANLVRQELGGTVLPAGVARRFPDLSTVALTPTINWSLHLATPRSGTRAATRELIAMLLADADADAVDPT